MVTHVRLLPQEASKAVEMRPTLYAPTATTTIRPNAESRKQKSRSLVTHSSHFGFHPW